MIEPFWKTEKRALLKAVLEQPHTLAAAHALGIGKTTLFRKLAEWGLKPLGKDSMKLTEYYHRRLEIERALGELDERIIGVIALHEPAPKDSTISRCDQAPRRFDDRTA